MKHYMVHDQDRVIWGIGLSRVSARKDAQLCYKDVKDDYDAGDEKPILAKAILCSERFYDHVQEDMWNEDHDWVIVNGLAEFTADLEADKISAITAKKIEDIAEAEFKRLDLKERSIVIFKELKRARETANFFEADLRAKGFIK